MFELINNMLDSVYFGVVAPLCSALVALLNLLFIKPLLLIGLPLPLHVALIATLTAMLSFALRHRLRVDEKAERFQRMFAEKRRRQQDLRLIEEKYCRQAMYEVTDDELNEDFNTYLAHHYARYVLIYLLPVFLTMAWLNSVFSEAELTLSSGMPYLIALPANQYGFEGLSVTFVFLLTYVGSLIIGFRLRRRAATRRTAEEIAPDQVMTSSSFSR